MYEDAMSGISEHLIQKSMRRGLTYTSELVPQRGGTGQMFVLVYLAHFGILIAFILVGGIWCLSKITSCASLVAH